MKHLKLFKTNSQYEEYVNDDLILPNVSYVEDDAKVYYNPDSAESSSYIAVDLGLPSGRLWADRNVGATSSEDYGLYFQWGDPVGYTAEQITNGEKTFSSDWSDYFDTTDGGNTFNKYAPDKLTVLEASDDAARANMGSDWRMPTQTEMQELIDNTTPTFIDLQGNEFSQSEAEGGAIAEGNLKGVKFTGSNGNSIFIPASGIYDYSQLSFSGSEFSLWSSDLDTESSPGMSTYAGYLFCDTSYLSVLTDQRWFGMAVRGVK